jgi:predicted DNA-binding protein (MmcQ/YjbR family)
VTPRAFNNFCASLPATTHVVQWGGSDVWKVGDRVFAIAGWSESETMGITFKTSDIAYEMLKDQRGLRPAPYLASRGMKWIQHYAKPGLSDKDLRHYLAESHRIVALGLTQKKQRELGLGPRASSGGSTRQREYSGP